MLPEISNVDSLFEDLHWLLLISAYLLADESDGETPLIPRGIMSYSSNLKDQVDLQASLQILCASQNQSSGSEMIFVLFSFLCEQCFVSLKSGLRSFSRRQGNYFSNRPVNEKCRLSY